MAIAGENAARTLRRALGDGPYVFKLGHGDLPQTPPGNVATLAGLLSVLQDAA